jgi:hypothetical protein
MSYIFDLTVKDNLWKETIVFIALFSGFLLFVNLTTKQFEVNNNWDRMRCRPEIMQYAWLYGKNQNDNMEYCLENAGKQVKQQTMVAAATAYVDNTKVQTDKTIRQTNMTLNNLRTKIDNGFVEIPKKNRERAVIIQNNILNLKEGLQKAIAGLYIQNNLNKGVLKTTEGTQKLINSLNKSLNP